MVYYAKQTRDLALMERPEAIKRAFAPQMVTELFLEPDESLEDLISPPPRPDVPSEQRPTFQVELLDAWRSP